jgi:hypothetical protein
MIVLQSSLWVTYSSKILNRKYSSCHSATSSGCLIFKTTKEPQDIIKYAANEIQVIQGKLTWLKEQQSWMLCPQWQCKVYTSSHKLNSQQYSINNMQPWEQLHFKLNITCTRLLNDQFSASNGNKDRASAHKTSSKMVNKISKIVKCLLN